MSLTSTLTTQDKKRALDLAVSTIEKQFGKGSIMRLGDEDPVDRTVEVISTGSFMI